MEWAILFFSGIRAAAAAFQVWQRIRDKDAAAKAFDETFRNTQKSREAHEAAQQLITIAPEGVIRDLEGRADECWTGYRRVLGGPYLPDEVDKATDAVQACVCRELTRIYKINGGHIPDRWKGQWDTYACSTRQVAPRR